MTDARLADALAQAKHEAEALSRSKKAHFRQQGRYLAGWAETVRELERGLNSYWEEHEKERPHPGDCDTCPKLEVIANFCDAMLGDSGG